jgi:hypothetical protein
MTAFPPPYSSPGPDGPSQGPVGSAPYGAPSGAPGPIPAAAPTPPPGTDLGTDLKESLNWGWKAFSRNVAAFLVPGVVYTVAMFVLVSAVVIIAMVIGFGVIAGASSADPDYIGAAGLGGMLVIYIGVFASIPLAMIPSILWQSGTGRAVGIVRDGGRPTIKDAFIGPGRLMLTALLYALLVGVGMVLFYVPGLIMAVLGFLALPAAINGARPIDAIKESVALVRANLGTVIVVYLVTSLIVSMASMFVVTIVVAVPLMTMVQVALYDRLNHRLPVEPVAA